MGEEIDLSKEDIWDDTLLIKAYDKSVNLSKNELAKRLAKETNKQQEQQQKSSLGETYQSSESKEGGTENYKVGDYIRATYDDGVDYEAKIISIDESKQTCTLKYIGYENEQEVKLTDLVPSWGKKARKIQYNKSKKTAETERMDDGAYEEEVKNVKRSKIRRSQQPSGKYDSIIPPPPPPMPPMLNELSEDSENLSAMLMSWYMSGYYTGLYHGQKIVRNRNKCKNQ